MLKNICHQSENIEIIFSRKDSKLKLRQELETEVERVRLDYLQKHSKINPKFALSYQHNPHYSHGGLQVADYVAYAIFQVFENRNSDYYDIIQNNIGKIQDICKKNTLLRATRFNYPLKEV